MTRLLGPDASTRVAVRLGKGGRPAQPLLGKNLTVYTDEACTQTADIAAYNGTGTPGATIPASKVVIDQQSKIPLFWFPDGVEKAWAKTAEGYKFELVADLKSRVALGAASARYSPGAVLADMGVPMRTAHRTGGSAGGYPVGPFPENTREGAIGVLAAASGIDNFVLNVQFNTTGDGTVIALHDSTVDRTTTGTGAIADLSYSAARALSVDADAYLGTTVWGNALKLPTVDEILNEFGGKVALNLAAYGASTTGIGQKLVSKVLARGIGPTVMISSFNTANLTPARDAGMATMYYPPDEGNTGAAAAQILATNVWAGGLPKYVGVSMTSSDAYIQSLIAAGLHVSVYFTSRRYERDRLLALGVQGLVSDDPIYQFTTGRLWTGAVDPYTLGAWPHGALDSDGNLGRGQLTANGLKISTQANSQHCVEGSRCPIAAAAGTYTISGSVTFDTVTADATRSAQLQICAPDDRKTSGTPSSGAGAIDGYTVLLRANGSMELYRNTQSSQANTKVGATQASAAIAQGATVPFTLQVTPTTITFTRTDTATSITWTDSAYRGAYFHVGKSTNIVVSWRITSIA